MTQPIQLIIDGTGAAPAAAELQSLPGITVETENTATGAPTRDIDLLTVTANIITITGGLATVELLRQWYLEWSRGKDDKVIDKVVLVVGEQRMLFKNTTKEQLIKILETF